MAYVHNRPVDAPEANVGAVMQMCAALAAAGRSLELTAYAGPDEADPFARQGLPPSFGLRLAAPRTGPLSYPALVWTALRRGGGEVVYTRVPQVALYAMALGREAVLEMHTPISALRRGRRLPQALNALAARLKGVVAISPALAAELRAELPRFRGPWLTAPSSARDLRAPADAPPPDHDFGYVGGVTPGKGAEMVLALAERLPGARLLLAGDLARRPELAARAAALPNLTVLGPVAPAAIAAVMARFRIALAPYALTVQGAGGSGIDLAPWMSPLKLAEYASAGKAILAARLPAVTAMLEEGREVAAAPADEPDGWTAAATRLLADPAAVHALGTAARAAFEARLSWDARAGAVIQAFGL